MIKGFHRQARKHIQATERSPGADKITNFDGRKIGEKKEEGGGGGEEGYWIDHAWCIATRIETEQRWKNKRVPMNLMSQR